MPAIPWYLAWLVPLVEKLGVVALEAVLRRLEQRFPGARDVFETIIQWLEGQKAAGNPNAVKTLSQHFQALTDAPQLKS